MRRYITIIYLFIFGNNLIFCQNKIEFKDTIDNSENYKKENGIVRYTNSSTKNSKQYYIQEQDNSFLMTFPSKSSINVANYFERTSNYFKFSENNQFILKDKKNDINGNNIYTFQQFFNGIKVEGGNFRIFENSDGQILTVIGKKLEVSDLNAKPTITLDMAINSAIEGLRLDFKDSLSSGITYLNADLLIIFNGTNNAKNEFVLTYEVKLNQENTHDIFTYYINANNGNIVKKKNSSFDDIAVGNGNTNYSGNQNFSNTFGLFDFILSDETRNITVYDANYSSFFELPFGLHSFQDNDNVWNEKVAHITSVKINSINDLWNDFGTETFPDIYLKFYDSDGDFIYATSPVDDLIFPYTFDTISAIKWPFSIEIWDFDIIGGDDLVGGKYVDDLNETYNYDDGLCNFDILKRVINRPEIDVFWGLQKTHEFYLNKYGRLGVDGSNAQIDAYLYLDPFYQNPLTNSYQINNATGNSAYQTIKFGLGDGIKYMPFVDLETVGHEYTHLVIGATSNLTYEGESGALNESFADIIGTSIDISLNGITETTWKHGEKHFVNPFHYSRSLSNPNLVYDPKTYKTDSFWVDVVGCEPSSLNDRCGVHTNSGVQNYWYYLLSAGGAGVNANEDEFNVTPIGWEKASQIAYYNMTEHLFSDDGYPAAAIGSLAYVIESEPDGANSATWNSVVNAWYAVGVLDNPAQFCSGLLELNESEGIITDGSIDNLYGNNSNCSWLIKPEGATSITLTFSEFFTEADHDTLVVYNGGAITDPILLIWHGNTIPPIVSSSVGEMLIVFRSDGDNNDYGWTANYISTTAPLGCTGTISLNTNTGFFSDGSGTENYTNNNNCSWLIAPLSASSITINFSSFSTEAIYDYVNVYDGYNSASPLLGTYSGTSIPASITTMGSAIYVQFISDGAINSSGWSANYTSDGIDPIITSMSTYEYWFDNNYFGKTDGLLSGPTPNFNESIDVSTLKSGLHSIHIRFKDNNNLWSSVVSTIFCQNPNRSNC
jgi:Zn-dependent metalloprotease